MMNREHVIKKFEKLGAKLGFTVEPGWLAARDGLSIDVVNQGTPEEAFAIDAAADVELQVLDCRKDARHLLLMARRPDTGELLGKYLCGHDERHWFVAGVTRQATNVRTAIESLKPAQVRLQQKTLRPKRRNLRRNRVFIRQGEWFFLAAPEFDPGRQPVLTHEPLVRSTGGKPHVAEQLVRFGGRRVYVTERYPGGISEERYHRILRANPAARGWAWQEMVRDPLVYAKGAIRHPDHKTVVLPHWYRVAVSAEQFTRTVAFLD